jgi:hypothetical protein
MRASAFGWRAAWRPAGGNPPAPAFPREGETGKGAIRGFLAAAGKIPSADRRALRSAAQGSLDALAPEHLEMVQRLLPVLDSIPLGAQVPQRQVQQLQPSLFAGK